ncbi:MAG: FAD-dependent oxidoreductase, partial [Bacillota bacterium]
YLLQGKTDRERMRYRPEGFYAENGCKTLFGKTAVRLDPNKKRVDLDDGTAVPYDRLLVATGSSPFLPPMEGIEKVKKRFSFMSLDDAEALEDALFPEARVLVVGAGLIGLKCAEGICVRVDGITVVDLAPRILSSILDEKGALLVQEHLERQGLAFRLGTSVRRFTENAAELASGEMLEFDLLVTAVGVRPNVALVKDAGGETDRGIIVDEQMTTTLPDIYAAGDCVESVDLSCGTRRVLAILPNAYTGGYAAGLAMAGGTPVPLKAMPMNAIGFFGLHILTAGSYAGKAYTESSGGSYKKLFYADDRLNGFIMIGEVDKAGIYTALIREGTPLSAIDFPLICAQPSLIALGRNYRAAKLGGEKGVELSVTF